MYEKTRRLKTIQIFAITIFTQKVANWAQGDVPSTPFHVKRYASKRLWRSEESLLTKASTLVCRQHKKISSDLSSPNITCLEQGEPSSPRSQESREEIPSVSPENLRIMFIFICAYGVARAQRMAKGGGRPFKQFFIMVFLMLFSKIF